jgi:hypothetical protein
MIDNPMSIRLDHLDSSRGIAALAVALFYCLHRFNGPDQLSFNAPPVRLRRDAAPNVGVIYTDAMYFGERIARWYVPDFYL